VTERDDHQRDDGGGEGERERVARGPSQRVWRGARIAVTRL
jgi:hypothetical protein